MKIQVRKNLVSRLLVLFSLIFICVNANATGGLPNAKIDTTNYNTAYQQLSIVQQNVVIAKQNLEVLKQTKSQELAQLSPLNVDMAMLTQAQLDLANAEAKLNDTKLTLLENERIMTAINANIRDLTDNIQNVAILSASTGQMAKLILAGYRSKIEFQKSLLDLEVARGKELQNLLIIAEQVVEIEQVWTQQVNQMYKEKLNYAKQIAIDEQIAVLQQQRQSWLATLSKLNQSLQSLPSGETADAQRFHLDFAILQASEEVSITHTQAILLQIQNRIADLITSEGENNNIAGFNRLDKQINLVFSELGNIHRVITAKIKLLNQRQVILAQASQTAVLSKTDYQADQKLINDLIVKYAGLDQTLMGQVEQLEVFQVQLQKDIKRELSRRQGMPGFNLTAWFALGKQLMTLPSIVYQGFASLAEQIFYSLNDVESWILATLAGVIVLWFAAWWLARHLTTVIVQTIRAQNRKLTTNVVYIVFELLRRNLFGIMIAGIFLTILAVTKLPYRSYESIVLIILVWFVFKLIIGLARIMLIETPVQATDHDVKLYHALQWVFILGGLLTACTVLVHQLPVPYEVSDFFNRLFMLFLFALGFLLLCRARTFPQILLPFIPKKRLYLMRIVQLMSILIPISLFSTAIIGILGYVDLAWTIYKYEGIFLLILSMYVLIRGFLLDVFELIAEAFIRGVSNGWLWTQAILKPLEKIVRLALLLCAIWVLFVAYGWRMGSTVVNKIIALLYYPLLHLADSTITTMRIIEFVVVVAIFAWAIRWSREFAYRWMFSNTKDLGLRNSFAVFTQYTMVIIGFFVLLHVLGISVLTLAAVLTVFGVGIAFGLRDVFKSYVCGVMLLLERPIKQGDFVSIGGVEGEVTNIGMRSFTVMTWDHTELVVPNSEAFDKPFTNWTLQDNIVRAVINLKINRVDDPNRIKAIVLSILEKSSFVVDEPAPQVLFKDLDDALIALEVRYYINLESTPSRAGARSQILFEIWEQFKVEGIRPPHSQQDIYVKSLPIQH